MESLANLAKEVNPRSGVAIGVTVLLTPFVLLFGGLTFFFLSIAVELESSTPAYPEGPPFSTWIAAVVVAVIFAFLAHSWGKLVYGLITGKGGTLVPSWLAYIIVGSFTLLGATFLALAWRRGDLPAIWKSIEILAFTAVLWFGLFLQRRLKKSKAEV